jgi:hypothetical protein
MEMEVLCKEDFADEMRGEPTVRITSTGVVCFNHLAVRVLKLTEKGKKGYSPVLFMRGVKDKSDFGVFRDPTGYQLRPANNSGGVMFNCVGLARHIIDATWDRSSHVPGAKKWDSYVFRIARKPLDDDKNKDVYALLRRKG